jgi:hypothetical protein
MVNAILNDDLTTLEAASAARVASTGGVYNGIYNDE